MKIPGILLTCDICLTATDVETVYGTTDGESWVHLGEVDICPRCYHILERAVLMGWINDIANRIIAKDLIDLGARARAGTAGTDSR